MLLAIHPYIAPPTATLCHTHSEINGELVIYSSCEGPPPAVTGMLY